jgi:hypothetical protein
MKMLNIFKWVFNRAVKELNQHDKEYEEMKERNRQFSEERVRRMAAKEIEFAKRKERNSRMFSSFRKDNK